MEPLADSAGAVVLGVAALVFLVGLGFYRDAPRNNATLWAFLIGIPVLPVIALVRGLRQNGTGPTE